MNEKDFEDILVKYPELIEEGLKLIGRQVTIHGRRMDLYFLDSNKRKLIVELKAVTITDRDIGQIIWYEGSVLSEKEPDIRIMLVGTRVPPSFQKALDHHGIAWKEITYNRLKDFVQKENDKDFLMLFDEKLQLPINDRKTPFNKEVIITKPQNTPDSIPALFIPIESRWIDEAFVYFKGQR